MTNYHLPPLDRLSLPSFRRTRSDSVYQTSFEDVATLFMSLCSATYLAVGDQKNAAAVVVHGPMVRVAARQALEMEAAGIDYCFAGEARPRSKRNHRNYLRFYSVNILLQLARFAHRVIQKLRAYVKEHPELPVDLTPKLVSPLHTLLPYGDDLSKSIGLTALADLGALGAMSRITLAYLSGLRKTEDGAELGTQEDMHLAMEYARLLSMGATQTLFEMGHAKAEMFRQFAPLVNEAMIEEADGQYNYLMETLSGPMLDAHRRGRDFGFYWWRDTEIPDAYIEGLAWHFVMQAQETNPSQVFGT